MRRLSLAIAAAALTAGPVAAQTWQAVGTPGNNAGGSSYWNNVSDDNVGNAICNVGSVLRNAPVALTAGSCSNQNPGNFLPVTPTRLNADAQFLGGAGGSAPAAFRFQAGTYSVSLLGRIAGISGTSWGFITDAGVVTDLTALGTGASATYTASTNFAVWIAAAIVAPGDPAGPYLSSGEILTGPGNTRVGTSNQQFAVFANTPDAVVGGVIQSASNPLPNTYFVGMEDNSNGGYGFGPGGAGARVSDRDYNDIMIAITQTTVPEPSTYALLSAGLVAVAGIARRRRA